MKVFFKYSHNKFPYTISVNLKVIALKLKNIDRTEEREAKYN